MTFIRKRNGTSLIDLLVSIAIIAVLFGGIYTIYFSIVTAIGNISVRTAAASAISAEIETIRNLPYDSVGTVGGVPSGVIPQSQSVSIGSYSFNLQTTVRNIDDPFDGTVSGNPAPVDTAPADYKLVEVAATCPLCNSEVKVTVTTTVAPKNLESATQNGSLFIYALDANGNPVADANVEVTNASVTPSINLVDTTNASGVLELVGVPTSTQGYNISVTKAGYSTDQTYPPGAPGNPNPIKPNSTIVAQTVTSITFGIDAVSNLTVYTSDDRCEPVPNEPFSIAGGKLIGTSPDVLKFSTTTATGATGTRVFGNVEWDIYTLALNDASHNIEGTIPLNPLTVDPSSTLSYRMVIQAAENPSLLVTTVDSATGAGIQNAVVTAKQGGFSETQTTGHSIVEQDDWSGSQYDSQSGGIDASTAGRIALFVNASGTYESSTEEWLVSDTLDLGGSNSTLYSLSWTPAVQSGGANVKFQIAENTDDATWDFVGPDGTAASYFTSSPSYLPAFFSGNRYIRYKVYMSTTNEDVTPEVDSVSIEFNADCVPPAQTLFTALPQGSYTVSVTAPNYSAGSSTVSVGSGEASTTVLLDHS